MPRWQQCREVKQTSQVLEEQHDEASSNTVRPEEEKGHISIIEKKKKNSWEIVSEKI